MGKIVFNDNVLGSKQQLVIEGLGGEEVVFSIRKYGEKYLQRYYKKNMINFFLELLKSGDVKTERYRPLFKSIKNKEDMRDIYVRISEDGYVELFFRELGEVVDSVGLEKENVEKLIEVLKEYK